MSASAIDRRVRRGLWRRLHPGVYLVADRAESVEARIRAGWLWAGKDATLCGVAAAWWHGLHTAAPSVVDVTVPVRRSVRCPDGLRCRRRDLAPADIVESRGVWLTGLPLTVLESAVAQGDAVLDRTLQQGLVRFEALVLARHRNLGWHGSAAAGRLLAAAADRTRSAAERVAVGLLRRSGLRGWICDYPVGGYVLDIAFPEHFVAMEIDGWAWHTDVDRFRADRRRQNALVLAGWSVLRFTWHDLTARPATWWRRSVRPCPRDRRLCVVVPGTRA